MSVINNESEFEKLNLFGLGAPNDAYAQYFTGQSFLNTLAQGNMLVANVSFEPGCRNNWHIHKSDKDGGQILFCVAGEGWYQEEGKPAQKLTPGTTVVIPPNVKHWHGATAESWFSHLALEVPGENTSNEWLGPVTDEQYAALG